MARTNRAGGTLQDIRNFWSTRSRTQQFAIIGGFLVSLLATLAFVLLAGRAPMALLYSGLDDARAAPVVAQLEQSGVSYELRNGSIWVDRGQRDRVRMDLAAQNLPQQGGAGYEILDGMSGFSATSQMFDAAYWRAKEGELARTILSIPVVSSARVHLTAPQSRGYRNSQPGSASVTVVTNGTPLSPAQADAMRFLISSAVPQLAPDAVSVIDSAHGIVRPSADQTASDRETRMKENVERILAPHVGAGNAIVELSIDLVTQTEQLTERSFDPTQRALISEENEEVTDETSGSTNPAVTAASNLPEQGSESGDRQQAQRAETRQRANYEVGSVTRQVEKRPGAVRRLSVAVLLNGVEQQKPDGTVEIQPRAEPELAAIRELVAAAVGYDEARGDEITVKSMPFVTSAGQGTLADRSQGLLDRLAVDSLAKLALIGIIALIALALALRGLRVRQKTAGSPAMLDDSGPAGPANHSEQTAIQMADALADSPEMPMLPMAAAEFDFDSPAGSTSDPAERLKRLMKERREETLKLLNGWIGADERSLP
ncbi:flagellar basal-body MS-ring/collar protein FliF [Paracoccus sp. SCSIO 75233]|uniref:flagellar basal-body MS-ring/collar protein FliF n=1 Tax=Paracoccus sp. SCSIO 75233 TaxID=3017782 RepID=UPI0022F1334F|nr:flagellar basal-body MS-ring/collar protein FliF [Paracoccus sp. SCSIO 75233]WBU53131.1 flagellar basal-body MS-ring/collar protein FliF [Paracoccus sp. SCSIO 75233]